MLPVVGLAVVAVTLVMSSVMCLAISLVAAAEVAVVVEAHSVVLTCATPWTSRSKKPFEVSKRKFAYLR